MILYMAGRHGRKGKKMRVIDLGITISLVVDDFGNVVCIKGNSYDCAYYFIYGE